MYWETGISRLEVTSVLQPAAWGCVVRPRQLWVTPVNRTFYMLFYHTKKACWVFFSNMSHRWPSIYLFGARQSQDTLDPKELKELPWCFSSAGESAENSPPVFPCIGKHRAVFLQLETSRLGKRGGLGLVGRMVTSLMYPTAWESLKEGWVCALHSAHHWIKERERLSATLDFLVNVLCCMCIIEAPGGGY